MTDLKDYIVVVKDVLSHEVCDAILREYSDSSEWQDSYTRGGLLKDIRNVQTILMSEQNCISINPEVRKNLDSEVFNGASIANRKYNDKFSHAHIEQDSGYELLRYKQGQFYTQHTDSCKDIPRTISCSFALNDNYEGGEFAFFSREISVRVPKGSAILFPSNFMYPHEILPVTSGIRYSIVTWFI